MFLMSSRRIKNIHILHNADSNKQQLSNKLDHVVTANNTGSNNYTNIRAVSTHIMSAVVIYHNTPTFSIRAYVSGLRRKRIKSFSYDFRSVYEFY